MIYEMPREAYERVRPVFAEQPHHPVIQGVIAGNNRGKIYVDDVETPRTALIWAQNELYLLGGDHTNDEFNRALEPFLLQQVAPEALAIGDDCFQVELLPADKWTPLLSVLFPTQHLTRYDRWDSVFHQELYQKLSSWSERVPQGYRIERIDGILIEEKGIEKEVGKFWPTPASFLEKGLGYAAVRDDGEIISCCISVYVAGQDVEIGINTYDPRERGKGLATLTARAFIDQCLHNGLVPHWTTETARADSIVIAERLGFVNQRVYPCYFFTYDENVSKKQTTRERLTTWNE